MYFPCSPTTEYDTEENISMEEKEKEAGGRNGEEGKRDGHIQEGRKKI